MTVPYPGYSIVEEVYMKSKVVEDAILIMLCCQNEGGSEKNFSRKDAPLHYLTAAVTSGIPPPPSQLPEINSHISTHFPLIL
jgi:hypothetical protein